MANATQLASLRSVLAKASDMFSKNLITRSEWGMITFDEAELDLKRAKSIIDYLTILPLENLPDSASTQIENEINSLIPVLDKIDKFSILTNAQANRDSLVSQLHTQVDNFYSRTSPWIPFLAYQKGDVAENLDKLSQAVSESKSIIEKAKSEVEGKRIEIDSIVAAARSASASAGAAVFTKDFEDESSILSRSATSWLVAGITCLGITILSAIMFWVYAHNIGALSTSQILQESVAKIIILSMLITGATWSARNYRALKHLATVNRHRALSLRTLQAFTAAASDEQTKNAVLLEATRAVFHTGSSGYLEGVNHSDDGSTKIIEIAKATAPKVN